MLVYYYMLHARLCYHALNTSAHLTVASYKVYAGMVLIVQTEVECLTQIHRPDVNSSNLTQHLFFNDCSVE